MNGLALKTRAFFSEMRALCLINAVFICLGLLRAGDSYYEYLLKQWVCASNSEPHFLAAYLRAVNDGVVPRLLRRSPPSAPGLHDGYTYVPKPSHFRSLSFSLLVPTTHTHAQSRLAAWCVYGW